MKKKTSTAGSTKITVKNVKAFVGLFNTFSIFGKSMMMRESVELMIAGGKLIIKGNNGELKMARAVEVDHDLIENQYQSILVPYARLSQSLKLLKGDVGLTIVEDDAGVKLVIDQDDKEYKITGEKVEDPITFVKKNEKTIRVVSDIFKAGLRKTLAFTEPVNTIRIAMTGVKLTCKSKVLTFWGTCGTIACRYDVPVDFDDEFSVLIPPATVKMLTEVETKEFELSMLESSIRIDYADGQGVVESALIIEPYPNIESVVDDKVAVGRQSVCGVEDSPCGFVPNGQFLRRPEFTCGCFDCDSGPYRMPRRRSGFWCRLAEPGLVESARFLSLF